MRHLGFVAGFCATCAVVVPLAWHPLDASIDRDGKRVRPLQQTLELDGAKVTLDVDRAIVHTGDAVHATLRAYADKPARVAVTLRVTRNVNYEGARVETPDKPIDRETFVLDAAPGGGKPVQTTLVLGKLPDRPNLTDNFRISIMPKGESKDDELPRVAAVNVIGWSGDSLDMEIVPRGPMTADAPFKVAVRVKNTTWKKLRARPWIRLGTSVGSGGEIADDADDFDIAAIDTKGRDEEPEMRAGAVITEEFIVTPKHAGKRVTFVANAEVFEMEPGPVTAGAMDLETFRLRQPRVASR